MVHLLRLCFCEDGGGHPRDTERDNKGHAVVQASCRFWLTFYVIPFPTARYIYVYTVSAITNVIVLRYDYVTLSRIFFSIPCLILLFVHVKGMQLACPI